MAAKKNGNAPVAAISIPLPISLKDAEKHVILAVLELHAGHKLRTALDLGIHPDTLDYKLKAYRSAAA